MKIETGTCGVVEVTFKKVEGASKVLQDSYGIPRPVVIVVDPVDNKHYAHNVTNKVDNPFNRNNGYVVKEWDAAGLHKESIVKCDRNNFFEIDPAAIKKTFGKLSDKDLVGFLQRLEHIRKREVEQEKGMER